MRPPESVYLPLAVVFLVVIGGLAGLGHVPWIVLAAYLALSVLSCIVHARDRSAARHAARHTLELRLQLLALLGGWPGALVTQQVLRHKTQKAAFQTVFWLCALVNTGALAAWWLLH